MSAPLSEPPATPRRPRPPLSFGCLIWGGMALFILLAIVLMLVGR